MSSLSRCSVLRCHSDFSAGVRSSTDLTRPSGIVTKHANVSALFVGADALGGPFLFLVKSLTSTVSLRASAHTGVVYTLRAQSVKLYSVPACLFAQSQPLGLGLVAVQVVGHLPQLKHNLLRLRGAQLRLV